MNIFDKLFGTLFASLNISVKKRSRSNKAKISRSFVNSIHQAGRDINISAGVTKPSVDIKGLSHSGGPEGPELYFEAVNIGDATAIDVSWVIESDDQDFSWESRSLSSNIPTGESRPSGWIRYQGSSLFTTQLNNPHITFRYKDVNGRVYTSGRRLLQHIRADGNFNLTLGEYLS